MPTPPRVPHVSVCPTMPNILTINAGSSSVRYALFASAAPMPRVADGKMERLGQEGADEIAKRVLQEISSKSSGATPDAIGHRVVHGMLHTQPECVTAGLLEELRKIIPFDPEHLPREIEIIEAMQREYPSVPQVVCFDTAFRRDMPVEATLLPIPRRYTTR